MSSPLRRLRPASAAQLALALAAVAASSGAAALSVGGRLGGDEAAEARQKILDEFGGVAQLCMYFNWEVRSEGSRRPEIFFATIVGNNGQQDVYELSFAEVYPFVSRIVALDPAMTQTGLHRNLSMDPSEARWQRYLHKLRHVALDSPIPEPADENVKSIPPGQRRLLERPGHAYSPQLGLELEQWTRAQLWRGLKDDGGVWAMHPEDIVLVADSDEIPLRESLLAMVECESQGFARVRSARAAGKDVKEACSKDAKVLLRSQVFEYYMDCPTVTPVWWHPDAVLAACVMEGGLDLEDVRTGSSGKMTSAVASRHIHNFGLSNEDVIFKYLHYAETKRGSPDGGLTAAEQDEMRWRACDPAAPEIGPTGWHMHKRPSNDFRRRDNARGWSTIEPRRRGVERPLALLLERPELADRLYWRGHGERGNPFVGGPAGNHSFQEHNPSQVPKHAPPYAWRA